MNHPKNAQPTKPQYRRIIPWDEYTSQNKKGNEKKMRRKLTAIILTLSMLVTMMPAVAMAESGTSTTLQSQSDAAEGATNSAASVSNGTDTTYHKTLADAIDTASTNATVTLLKDIEENVTIAEGKDITLDLNGKTLTCDKTKKIPVILNNGTLIIRDSSTDESGLITRNDEGSSGYYVVDNQGTLTIKNGYIGNKTGTMPNGSSLIRNAGLSKPATLNIEGGTLYQDGFIAVKNDDHGILNVSGGHIYTTGDTLTNVASAIQNWGTATISGGTIGNIWASTWSNDCASTMTIDGDVTMSGKFIVEKNMDNKNIPTVTIKSGKFDAEWRIQPSGKLEIFGGDFTSDPSDYLAEGKTVTGQDAPYLFKVVDKTNDAAAEVVPAAPDAEVTLPENASKEDKNLAESVAAAIAPTAGKAPTVVATANMTAAASTLAAENNTTEDTGKAALAEAGITVTDSDTVKIVVQPYVDIKVTAADATNKTMTLDITPMYQKVATTADAAKGDDIVVKEDDSTKDANAVVIDEPQELDVKGDVNVTIPLPAGFTNESELYVGHKAKSGNYIYKGAVDEKGILTFTNPHGFSKFTVGAKPTMTNSSDANNVRYYDDFTTALNDAKDGETITLTDENATYIGTMTGDKRSVKLTNNTAKDITVKINGDNIVVPAKGDVTYTYEKEVASVETYDIDIEAVNGSVTASHKFAAKGATVTLTPVAKDGYKLDSIKVCPNADGGDALELKALANGTFSFKMPACDVTVHASFVPENEDATLPFKDVDTDDWFYGDVAFVYENGIMSGMATDTFAPQTTTTRGMIVCMLHRMEGEVAPSGSNNFTDVTPGAYYENAITWASENGIVNGYSDTAFGPNDAITREQMAAILYRYAQYKNMDVSIGESTNILSYTDAQDVSSYAMKPMQWAVGSGLIGGMTQATLVPQGQATRAQVAAIFHRFCTMDAK